MNTRCLLTKSAIALAGLLFLGAIAAVPQKTESKARKSARSVSAPDGQQIFASNCVGCHGLDGTGTQRAPNIVSNPQVSKLSAEDMFHIVSEGVPGTGMPAFNHLGAPAVKAIVAYVRSMQGKTAVQPLPGDPRRGAEVFAGIGKCSDCHMVKGHGGFLGPDLSSYAQTHATDAIRAAILDPSTRNHAQGLVTAVNANGEHYEGIVRNEDNFSLQLQSSDGAFHMLSKADLKSIERSSSPLMPSDYGTRLSTEQLNDLISYLIKAAQSETPAQTHHSEEE
jgi:putative heme-binding domain-containing protein